MQSKKVRRIKQSATDFTYQNLPHNRVEVFFDVVKLHWKSFLLFGLVFLLFCLPTQGLSLLRTLLVNQAYANAGELTDQTKVELASKIMSLDITAAILQLPCTMILAIAISGFSKIIKQYCWLENVYFRTDFFGGIKENYRQTGLLALIIGVVYVLSTYSVNYAQVVNNVGLSILAIVPVGVGLFVGIPVCAYAVVGISIYKNSFKQILITSFACFVKSPIKSLLAVAGCLLPFALQLIPDFLVMIIAKVVLSFIIPFVFLGWYLFALQQLDKTVNAQHYPSIFGKGTFPKD